MARTVLAAFDELLTRVALTAEQRDIGSTRQTNLRDFLKDRFTLDPDEPAPNPWLIGSYARNTILRQERDLDIMVALAASKYWDTYKTNSSGFVRLVRDALNKEYAKSDVSTSGAAVVMEMTVFNVDVVPVFRRSGGGYLVAAAGDSWKASNPNVHFNLMEEHNKKDDKLKPLVKLVKYWNNCNGSLLRSFHLELMVEQMWQGVSIGNYPHGVKETIRVLQKYIPDPFNDPWPSGGRVDGYLSSDNRDKVLAYVKSDTASATKAEELRNQSDDHGAFEHWQKVFANQFPAYG